MHRGLYSVPISYMQSHIDPIGLAEVMQDKVIVQPSTQKVAHAKANIEGTWKKLLRPMKPPIQTMQTTYVNQDGVGVKRGRLEAETSTECTSIMEPRKRPRSKGHNSDKTA